MRDLTDMIRSAVVCRRDSAGKIQLQRVKGSSISLPLVDEQKTRVNIERLMAELLDEMPAESVLSAIKEPISVLNSKSRYCAIGPAEIGFKKNLLPNP
jgi:hypothetical protein